MSAAQGLAVSTGVALSTGVVGAVVALRGAQTDGLAFGRSWPVAPRARSSRRCAAGRTGAAA